MKIFIQLFIFLIVFFFYLHIIFHLKTNNQSEIYEIHYSSKQLLENACHLRLPVVVYFASTLQISTTTKLDYLLQYFGKDEIHVSNKLLKLQDFCTNKNGISEKNNIFIHETHLINEFKKTNIYFRPPLMSLTEYDIIIGHKDVITPFCYELNYRNYLLVTQGSVKIKLAPPQSTRYLTVTKDYENFIFSAEENPWVNDLDKIKISEITLLEGQMIYIPSYWWYSMKMEDVTSITVFKYKPIMNVIANTPHYFRYFLQQQNIQKRFC